MVLSADILHASYRILDVLDDSEQFQFDESISQFDIISIPGKNYKLICLRLSSEFEPMNTHEMSNSLMAKRLRVDSFVVQSYTAAAYLDYQVNYKYLVRGLLDYERPSSNQRETDPALKQD